MYDYYVLDENKAVVSATKEQWKEFTREDVIVARRSYRMAVRSRPTSGASATRRPSIS